jgi:hypothetical protein
MKDTLSLIGKYRFQCFSKDGGLKFDDTVNNLVTTAGKANLALLCGDATAVPFLYIAVGTSSTSPTVGDTTLTAEIVDSGLERAAGTVSRTTTTVTNDTYQITKTFSVTGTKTIEEVGVLTASSGGVLLSHALSGSKAVINGDQLVVTYTLAFA